MSAPKPSEAVAFTPAEQDYIRRELDMFFSTLPSVAEGFHLKTWRGGPQAGQPKVPPVAAGLVERGLMRLDATTRAPRLFFTQAGLAVAARNDERSDAQTALIPAWIGDLGSFW